MRALFKPNTCQEPILNEVARQLADFFCLKQHGLNNLIVRMSLNPLLFKRLDSNETVC